MCLNTSIMKYEVRSFSLRVQLSNINCIVYYISISMKYFITQQNRNYRFLVLCLRQNHACIFADFDIVWIDLTALLGLSFDQLWIIFVHISSMVSGCLIKDPAILLYISYLRKITYKERGRHFQISLWMDHKK